MDSKISRETLEKIVAITAPLAFAALATVGFNHNDRYEYTSELQFYKNYTIMLLTSAGIGYFTTKWNIYLERSGFFDKEGLGGQS